MSKEIEYRGYTIVIEFDDVESDMSPRECDGNLGKMVCFLDILPSLKEGDS